MTTSRLAHQHHQPASNAWTSSWPPATTLGCPSLQRNSSFRLPHSPSWASSSTVCPGRRAYPTRSSPNYVHFWMPSQHVTPAQNAISALGKLNFAASVVAAGRTFMRHLWDCASSMPELYHNWPSSARRICGGRTTGLPDGTADHSSCTTSCLWPHPSTAALMRLAQLATELTTTAACSAEHGRPSNTLLRLKYGTLSDHPHGLNLES